MNIRRLIVIIILFSATSYVARGSVVYTKTDSLIYESYIKQFSGQQDTPVNELIIKTAIFFLGKPYVSSTLELTDNEQLIINLREFDCTMLVENCLALSNVVKSGDFSFLNYCNVLTSIRYRDGVIDGYPSRLHYMSDWIYENEKSGVLENMSAALNGMNRQKQINFMTTHAQLYPHLKNNLENIEKLQKVENAINNRTGYGVIPLATILAIEDRIQSGNIIVFETGKVGLDYSHVAIAYRVKDELRFIHASSQHRKVIVEDKSLIDYCSSSKTCSGITILKIKHK